MTATILFWVSKKRVFLPLLLIVLYHLCFNSYTGQYALDKGFQSITENGELTAEVTRFSLFFGVEIESIQLRSKLRQDLPPVLTADRLSILYNLPSLFLGRISVREIGIYNAKIHLVEDAGVWNYQDVFPDSGEKVEKPEPTPLEDDEPLESISTYIPVSLYARIILESISFRMEKRSPTKPLDLGFNSLSLDFILDSNRFRSIPLDLTAIQLIDRLHLDLNPNGAIPFWFKDKSLDLESPLDLSLHIHKENDGEDLELVSNLKFGGNSIPIRRRAMPPLLVDLFLGYNLNFFPEKDEILLKDFKLDFQGDRWLELSGRVGKPMSKDRDLDLLLSGSRIDFTPVSNLLKELPIDNISLGGILELSPLHVTGSFHDIQFNWKVKGKNIFYAEGRKKYGSRFLDLDINASLDLETDNQPTAEDPIPILKSLTIRTFRAEYNGLVANLEGVVNPTTKVDLVLRLERVNLSEFVSSLGGYLDASLKITGDSLASLSASLDGRLTQFRFYLDRSRSGFSKNMLNAKISVKFTKPFGLSEINVQNLDLTSQNSQGHSALKITSKAKVFLEKETRINLETLELQAQLTNLIPILPLSLKEKVVPLEANISKSLSLKLNGAFNLGSREYNGKLKAAIPGIELADLDGNFSIKMPPGSTSKINIEKLELRAYANSLGIDASGLLYEKPGAKDPPLGSYFGNINLSIFLKSKEEKYIARGLSYRGDLMLGAKIVDGDLHGDLISNNSRIIYNNGLCPGDDCKIFLVDNLKANIPIHHNLLQKTTASLIEGDKSRFIKSYGRAPEINLSIDQVLGSHPSIVGAPFAYIKSDGKNPGLVANIQYKENYLFIDGLKLSLLGGVVSGKDVIVNVGSAKPESMEFMATLQVRDIDLKQLLSRESQGKIDDGKIKADLNVSGSNLSDPISNLNLYFSIFQIGRDFGKSAMNVISTKGVVMDYIADSYAVDKVEIELSKGLVYADILFKRSLLNFVLSLEDGKISQQRMPLANFLKRAENEISTYK